MNYIITILESINIYKEEFNRCKILRQLSSLFILTKTIWNRRGIGLSIHRFCCLKCIGNGNSGDMDSRNWFFHLCCCKSSIFSLFISTTIPLILFPYSFFSHAFSCFVNSKLGFLAPCTYHIRLLLSYFFYIFFSK